MGTSKLAKQNVKDLVYQPRPVDKELRMQGYPSYRILRHQLSEQFNYVNPGIKGQRQTDFVISPYKQPEYKLCSLDLVNAVAYLAFIDPDDAFKLEFNTEYLYMRRLELQKQENADDLESQFSEDDLGDYEDMGQIYLGKEFQQKTANRVWSLNK